MPVVVVVLLHPIEQFVERGDSDGSGLRSISKIRGLKIWMKKKVSIVNLSNRTIYPFRYKYLDDLVIEIQPHFSLNDES